MLFRSSVVAVMLAVLAAPAGAKHPEGDLDATMTKREKFFEAVDRPAPDFDLVDARGRAVSLSGLSEKIVVLHFIFASCPGVCPLHAEKLADVQRMINASPMKDLVQFVSITTDPANDTVKVLEAYGPEHGLDPVNWKFLTVPSGRGEATTRTLAKAFNHEFVKQDDGLQTHGVVTHVIDKGGRWAANFHGLEFENLNLVLYVNGLTNSTPHAHKGKSKDGFFQRIWESIWG